jgi:hypothetical protein
MSNITSYPVADYAKCGGSKTWKRYHYYLHELILFWLGTDYAERFIEERDRIEYGIGL